MPLVLESELSSAVETSILTSPLATLGLLESPKTSIVCVVVLYFTFERYPARLHCPWRSTGSRCMYLESNVDKAGPLHLLGDLSEKLVAFRLGGWKYTLVSCTLIDALASFFLVLLAELLGGAQRLAAGDTGVKRIDGHMDVLSESLSSAERLGVLSELQCQC